jgi:hypothetical protein
LGDRLATFAYVKTNATVLVGQTLALDYSVDDADVDAAATTSESTLTGTGDFTVDEFAGMGGWVVMNVGAGIGQGASYIKSNSANILYLDRDHGEALTTGSDYVTFAMNMVQLADDDAAATIQVCGVAISALTSGQFGWIQVSGLHSKVRAAGDTDPLVAGEPVMADTAAGSCRGYTAGGTAADEEGVAFGTAMIDHAEATTADEGAPVHLDRCIGKWI